MPDDRFDDVFDGIDGPVRPAPEFEVALLERLLDELEGVEPAAPAPAPARQAPVPPGRWRPPAWLRLGSVAAAVAVACVAIVVLLVTRGPQAQAESALAVMREARADAATSPPFEALLVLRTPTEVGGKDTTTRVTHLEWSDERHWRRETVRSNSPFPPVTGTVETRDGALIGTLVPDEPDRFEVRRGRRAERGNDLIRPEPGALRIPEGETFAGFFGDRCRVLGDARVAGRPARRVACRYAGERARFWVDARTGLLLRMSIPDQGIFLNVRRIAYRPRTTAKRFPITPPAGAELRWLGPGVAPERFRAGSQTGRRVTVVAAGRNPSGVAVAEGVTWVAVPEDDRVRTFDAVTLVPGANLEARGGAVAAAAGGAWVVDEVGGTLTRLRADGGAATTDLGGSPQGVAVGAGGVWVADYEGGLAGRGTLVRVDPATGAVLGRTAVGPGAERVAVGAGAVWVTNSFDGSVSRVDPGSGRVTARIPVVRGVPSGPQDGLGDVAVGAGGVWVVSWPGDDRGILARIDPATNRVTARIAVGTGPNRVTVAGGRVWVANPGDDTVTAIDPATHRVVATYRTGGGPSAITAGAGAVWVLNAGEGTLARIALEGP
ncbi:MAG TPA: hypothetical protein PKD59_10860 [Miltoncostaeaceae bacterium]|nr:hypothetical protein [Miltoncostaeaceae bacterium]